MQPCAESLAKVAATGIGATAGGVIGSVLGKITRSSLTRCTVRRSNKKRLANLAQEEASVNMDRVLESFSTFDGADLRQFLSLNTIDSDTETFV